MSGFNDNNARTFLNQTDPLQINYLSDFNLEEQTKQMNDALMRVNSKLIDPANKEALDSLNESLDNIVQELGAKYNIKIEFKFTDTLASFLKNIMTPTSKRVCELIISELVGRFRTLQTIKLVQSTALLMDQVLNPAEMLNPKYSYEDKFGMLTKVFEFWLQIEEVYEKIKINDAHLELSHMTDNNSESLNIDPSVTEFLNQFRDSIIDDSRK